MAGALSRYSRLGRSPTGIGSHDPEPPTRGEDDYPHIVRIPTSPPSCAPENQLHLCADAPSHFDRGIHRETDCIYHPSCLSHPMVKCTGDMTLPELNSLIHAVRKQRAAFSIAGGQ